jgi:hypothetical protein
VSQPPTSVRESHYEPGLLACLSETRIGLFDFSDVTCTEPLSYVSGSSQRASFDSWSEVVSDLVLFTQEDPFGNPGGRFEVALRDLVTGRYSTRDIKAISPTGDIEAVLRVAGFDKPYAYAGSNPIANTDPSGLGPINKLDPRCWYWGYICTQSGAACKKCEQEWLGSQDEGQQAHAFEVLGVTGESGFFLKVCFFGLPSCQKAIIYCAKTGLKP